MGWRLNFDGINDTYVEVAVGATNPELDISGDVTIEAVIRPTTGSVDDESFQNIIRSGIGTDERYGLFYDRLLSRIRFESYSGTFDAALGANNDALVDTKMHVAAVRESNVISLYVNGVLSGTPTSLSAPTVTAVNLRVGSLAISPTIQAYVGAIDEVRVYSRAIDADEVAQHARGIFENNTGLELLWKLDDGSGTTATDDSGNSNDGTISGATWVSGNLHPNRVLMVIWEHAGEVALGDPIQYTAAVIDGVNSAVISGNNKKRRRVRLYAEADCWIKVGASPTATGGSDSMPLSIGNPEYIDIEAGHVLTAITR